MTTNIGLVTSDAVVLGCDSIASASTHFINPMILPWARDADGKAIKDAEGRFSLKFSFSDFESVVTDSWGGVTKLFQVHPDPSPVVAVTAGLAKLRDRPIASWGNEFFAHHKARQKKKLISCRVIANAFLTFVRAKYDEHYKGSDLPEVLREGPEFLLGGWGRDDDLPSMFRVKVKENTCVEEFGPKLKDMHSGILWNGQSDAVERFVRGYDSEVRLRLEASVEAQLNEHAAKTNEYVTKTINQLLDKLKRKMPKGIEISLPAMSKVEFDWRQHTIRVNYSNLPLQEAVNFVAFLVNIQSGRARFGRGVPSVGGRTHIGLITKEKGFMVLNEPELTHRNTGFGDDNQ